MQKAGLDDPSQVHFVQIKSPLLTAERISVSDRPVATTDTLKSMGMSRGASALGVAVALGEVDLTDAEQALLSADRTIWSSRASTSAGVELMGHEVLVLGMSNDWSGPLLVDHAVMQDAIDTAAVTSAMQRHGMGRDSDLRALFAKAEASSFGRVRGARHVMLDDSDISSTRHARALVGGVLAGLTSLCLAARNTRGQMAVGQWR